MKNEIKEAIDNLNGIVKGIYRMDEAGLEIENIKIILDYIINLQEENRILKENAEHNDKVVDKAKWNEMIYKSRNEKAMKFLEHFDSGQQCKHTKDLAILVKIILQGDDKE